MSAAGVRKRLHEVCEVRRGSTITESATAPGKIPVVAGGLAPTYFHAEANRGPGVITVSSSGANAGHVSMWLEPIWASDCSTVEPRQEEEVDARFVYHQLKSMEGRIQASLRKGAAQPHVYAKDLAQLEVVVPPIEHQRRVASVLDSVDAMRVKRQKVLAKLDTLAEAIEARAFSGQEEKGELGTFVSFLTSGARGWARYYSESGSRFVRSIDVQMNAIAETDAVFVSPEPSAEARRITVCRDDVLLTITGSRIGRAAVAPATLEGAFVSQHVSIIRVDRSRLLPEFLALWLCHPAGGQRQIARYQYGQTKPGLNFDQIRSFELPLLSLECQHSLVRAVDHVFAVRDLGRANGVSADRLFASLLQRAFRGEL